jgi:GTP cyclohydrolase II
MVPMTSSVTSVQLSSRVHFDDNTGDKLGAVIACTTGFALRLGTTSGHLVASSGQA